MKKKEEDIEFGNIFVDPEDGLSYIAQTLAPDSVDGIPLEAESTRDGPAVLMVHVKTKVVSLKDLAEKWEVAGKSEEPEEPEEPEESEDV